MKTLIVLTMLLLSACSTTYTKRWTVHPDDRARFDADYARCTNVAQTYRHGETVRDRCLTEIGYRLDVIQN